MKSLGEILRDALRDISFDSSHRYILNGVQLKMLLAMFEYACKLHDQQSYPDMDMAREMELAKDFFENIANAQSIGTSTNSFSDDIRDLRNLFASWCSKTS